MHSTTEISSRVYSLMGALFMTLTLGNHPMYSDQLISTHIAHNPEVDVCFWYEN